MLATSCATDTPVSLLEASQCIKNGLDQLESVCLPEEECPEIARTVREAMAEDLGNLSDDTRIEEDIIEGEFEGLDNRPVTILAERESFGGDSFRIRFAPGNVQDTTFEMIGNAGCRATGEEDSSIRRFSLFVYGMTENDSQSISSGFLIQRGVGGLDYLCDSDGDGVPEQIRPHEDYLYFAAQVNGEQLHPPCGSHALESEFDPSVHLSAMQQMREPVISTIETVIQDEDGSRLLYFE